MLIIKGGQPIPDHDIIPTPSLGINRALGGGIATGGFTTIWGNPGSGKTTMSLRTLANAQEMGYVPVIVDAEGALTEGWAEKCGLDQENRIYIRCSMAEDLLKTIIPMLEQKDAKHVFLIDSINSLVLEQFYKNPDGGQAIGLKSRTQGYLTQKITNYMSPDKLVIFIAQQRMNLGSTHAFREAGVGNAVNHWSNNIIGLFATGDQSRLERDSAGRVIRREIDWTIQKTRQGPSQGLSGKYGFYPADAKFDIAGEVADMAVEMGIVVRSGAWYAYNGDKVQGKDGLHKMVEENLDELRSQVLSGG